MKLQYMIVISIIFFLFSSAAEADTLPLLSKGQTVYVPAYSHIYIGNRETPYLLAVTLSIRNISPSTPIHITEVRYHDTQGNFLRHFIKDPMTLGPLSATRFIIHQSDKDGGSGASFIVLWEAKEKTNPPIIETVMIGTSSQQGISFTSRGEAILEKE
jgi:hypothetical protein